MNITGKSALPLTAIAIALAGCAGMEPNQSLEDARAAVRNAGDDPYVVEAASIEYDRARDALQAAESIYNEEGNSEPERLDHQSYLARRYAETAMALADGARAEETIDSAEAERTRVLLEIRTAEAERNEARAEAAQIAAVLNERQAISAQREAEAAQRAASENEREAQAAERRASAAQAQANALAEELSDLQAQQTDRGLVLTLSDVLFDIDESVLKPGADNAITQLAEFLNEYPERALIIEGHTDSTGPDSYNTMLSESRARAVAEALQQRGISRARLEVRGLGESQPVASNETDAGRQQNRRVEVIVTDEEIVAGQ